MKPSILKTAFQAPLPTMGSIPVCLSHFVPTVPLIPPVQPSKALHLLLPTSVHLHRRAFTHPVLPQISSPSSLCIHFPSTLQDPDEKPSSFHEPPSSSVPAQASFRSPFCFSFMALLTPLGTCFFPPPSKLDLEQFVGWTPA